MTLKLFLHSLIAFIMTNLPLFSLLKLEIYLARDVHEQNPQKAI